MSSIAKPCGRLLVGILLVLILSPIPAVCFEKTPFTVRDSLPESLPEFAL